MRTETLLFQGLALFLFLYSISADVYLHNPRGSNDRLEEANTNRDNANRLFNSQNNGKGGYCWGPSMSYYEGSQLTVEWTSQHGCGPNPKLYCNIVIQYMCGQTTDPAPLRVRDGSTTDRIEDSLAGVSQMDGDDYLYGMHEGYDYYQACKNRQRNLGLFIADRATEGGLTPNGRPTALFTRQENNDNRHGFECPEDKDYYPYWAWTPWRDVAVLTQDESYCDFYRTESQNVKSRWACINADGEPQLPISQDSCLGIDGNQWVEYPAWGISAPDCVATHFSRDNHLGNGPDGWANTYNWTLPRAADETCIQENNCECVLRLRYNISTYDLGSNDPANSIDITQSGAQSPVQDDPIVAQDGQEFMLAMDTTQFGRTFQDRTYVFHIIPRPDGIDPNVRIFNLNVRGKRGNIVQTYPAVEYDFVPETLHVYVGDYIHFQWTGCDQNPAGNAGEGTDQTDRSNIVQLETLGVNYPATDDWISNHDALFPDNDMRMRFAYLDQVNCLSYEELLSQNNNDANDAEQDTRNCLKLNAASQYFDGGLVRMNISNEFYYMSTRNNNFSNRGQKGTINVRTVLSRGLIGVIAAGGALFALSGGVAGAMLYAKSHPHSGVAQFLAKF